MLERQFPIGNTFKCVKSDKSIEKTTMLPEGKWSVIFFYPKDFTFVCPTEIVDFNNHKAEFDKLNAEVFGVSPDNEYCKLAWRNADPQLEDRKSTRLNSSHSQQSRMPSSA